jgi:flagellar hook assembly protein FlgD
MGQLVKSLQFDNFQAGFHQVQWNSLTDNGQKVPSGMYIVRMKAISTEGKKMFQKSQKIVYLK